jgi:hypothetical protein
MVARASGEDPGVVAREAAAALAGCADDPRALVTACRRLVDLQSTSGPVWWLAARVLAASDPTAEAWRAADALGADPTPAVLVDAFPDHACLTVLGWPEQAAEALGRRGDARVLVVDSLGDGRALVSALQHGGSDAQLVPESGVASAVAASTLVVLDASAVGPSGFLAVAGSRAAAAVAYTEQVPVWVVAGVGRVLPHRLWVAMAKGVAADEALSQTDCPHAPELLGGGSG